MTDSEILEMFQEAVEIGGEITSEEFICPHDPGNTVIYIGCDECPASRACLSLSRVGTSHSHTRYLQNYRSWYKNYESGLIDKEKGSKNENSK